MPARLNFKGQKDASAKMSHKKKAPLSALRRIRILGCCNICYDLKVLRPHEVGAYASELLDRLGIYTSRSEGGINDSIVHFGPENEDVILLDDVGIEIGNFKIRKLSQYGKRGHNAVRACRRLKSNPWLILIGAGPVQGDLRTYVNQYFSINDSNKLKIFINCLVRGLVSSWPNVSLVSQVVKLTFSEFKKCLSQNVDCKKC